MFEVLAIVPWYVYLGIALLLCWGAVAGTRNRKERNSE